MRAEKQLLLDEIQSKMGPQATIVLARYHKLDPNLAFSFRSRLGAQGAALEVVKKRLLMKAAAQSGYPLDEGVLSGHSAVIHSEQDPISMTKAIYQFMGEHEEIIEILGGRFEGKTCAPQDVKAISQLPSKEEMRAQFLSVLEAPMAGVLGTIDQLLTSALWCLNNKSQQ